jgi:hypothetical protein
MSSPPVHFSPHTFVVTHVVTHPCDLVWSARPRFVVTSLGFNQIGDEGAIALGEALAANTTLRRLHVNGNKVGQDGAVALAIALVDNAALEQLNVGANQIDAPGALAILEALRYGNHRSDQ